MNLPLAPHRSFAGFTLVETMVAIVIGMLATFIVMQIFAVSEGEKRTITGGADAQSDGAVALYLMERDLRQAGYGFSPNPEDFVPAYTAPPGAVLTNGVLAQCTTVSAYKANRATTIPFVYLSSTFAPVVINPDLYPAGDAGTDIVLVNYGTTSGMIGKGVLLQSHAGGDADYVLNIDTNGDPQARAQFRTGDLILAVPPPLSGLDCTLAEITGLPENPGPPDCTGRDDPTLPAPPDSHRTLVSHGNVTYPNFYTGCDPSSPTTATWNAAGPGGVAYAAGSKLYNLGAAASFVSRVYAVRNGNLTMCDLTLNDCTAAVADPSEPVWTPVAKGVVGLKAQYGHDADFDGTIDGWDATTPLGAARANVVAMRLAVVVRSGTFEKDIVTAAAPLWRADEPLSTDNIPLIDTASPPSADWQNYRYKTAQSLVPLRNMIWGEQN